MQNHRLAVAAPGKVRSICVEAQENLDLAKQYKVASVPQQLFNEDLATSSVGVQSERAYVRSVLRYSGVAESVIDTHETEAKREMSTLPVNPEKPVVVNDANLGAAIAQYPFLIVDCWAEWCGPCRMLGPVIEQLAGEMKGSVVFGKLDTEENQGASAEYGIHSIPTMLVFSNGKLLTRLVGFKPKPALKKEIEALLPKAS
jgi:thioredoxin 1